MIRLEGGVFRELLSRLEQWAGPKFGAVKMVAKSSIWHNLKSTHWGSVKVTYDFTCRKVFPNNTFLTQNIGALTYWYFEPIECMGFVSQ